MNKTYTMRDGREVYPLVTSHSIDGTFDFCQRKFEFAHVWQQTPQVDTVGLAAEAGTAMHEAIQAWASVWLAPGANQTETLMSEAIDAGIYALMEWWPWVTEIIAHQEKRLAAKQRSLIKAIELLMTVVRHDFWTAFELAVLPDGRPAIEIPYRVVHASLGTAFDPMGRERVLVTQGKIDFVLRHKGTGLIQVYDLKTTTKVVESLEASFRFSGQALGYSVILQSVIGADWRKGINVTFLTVNFVDRMVRPLDFFISRQEVDDYLRTRERNLGTMLQNLSEGWWPRRQHGCDNFNSACPYMDVCRSRDEKEISIFFADDRTPFAERTRIYDTLWTLEA